MDPPTLPDNEPADGPDWRALHHEAGLVFRPTIPVDVLDVFTGRGREIARICDVISQSGQHAILFGERGVGKTSLANVLSEFLHLADPEEEEQTPVISPRINCDGDDTFDRVWRKVFSRIQMSHTLQVIGFNREESDETTNAESLLPGEYRTGAKDMLDITPDAVRGVLARLGRQSVPIIVVDEFDRLSGTPRRAFADLVKTLSDYTVPATVVLVGVADSIDGLLQDHESISRALVQVHMERMPGNEIQQVLMNGTKKLGMTIEKGTVLRVASIAQGLPHYAHLLGLHVVRTSIEARTTNVTVEHLHQAVRRAVSDTHHSTVTAYHEAIRSAHKISLFPDVLLACALARCDEIGFFTPRGVCESLRRITQKKDYDIPNFARHLSEFQSERRGRILEMRGSPRNYRYRFRDPLMQPFVIMQGDVSGHLPDNFLLDGAD